MRICCRGRLKPICQDGQQFRALDGQKQEFEKRAQLLCHRLGLRCLRPALTGGRCVGGKSVGEDGWVYIYIFTHTWGGEDGWVSKDQALTPSLPLALSPSLPLSLSPSLSPPLQKHLAMRNAESFVPTDLSCGSLGRSTLDLHTHTQSE